MRCSNWSSTGLTGNCDSYSVSLFQKNEDDKLIYVGGRFVPAMEVISEGVTSLKMISRPEHPNAPMSSVRTPTSSQIYNWDHEDIQNDLEKGTFFFCSRKKSILNIPDRFVERRRIVRSPNGRRRENFDNRQIKGRHRHHRHAAAS